MTRFAIGLLILGIVAAHAHDAEHYPQMSQADRNWYNGLTNRNKHGCCSSSDAVRVEDPDWEIGGDRYRVRIDGQWFDVPSEALVDGPNKAGTALAWPYSENGETKIRCFMPGTGG